MRIPPNSTTTAGNPLKLGYGVLSALIIALLKSFLNSVVFFFFFCFIHTRMRPFRGMAVQFRGAVVELFSKSVFVVVVVGVAGLCFFFFFVSFILACAPLGAWRCAKYI